MTIAQQLEQKGIEKGIQLGEQRGIEKGEREATLKIARTMLQNGIDRNTVMKMTGLTRRPGAALSLIILFWAPLSGCQSKLTGKGSIPFRLCLPATPVKQLHHTSHITAQTCCQRIYLLATVVKSDIEVCPGQINPVYARFQGNSMPARPFPVAQQTAAPVHIFRRFQDIGQPEQIIPFRQLAGAGTPEVIQLAGQLCPDAQLAALLQHPLDVGCYIT